MLHFGFITIGSFHIPGILVPDYVGNMSIEFLCLNIGGPNIGKWVTLIAYQKIHVLSSVDQCYTEIFCYVNSCGI